MSGFQLDMMANGMSAGLARAVGNADLVLGQTALGSTQGTALSLLASAVEFTTVASGTGALLPAPGFRTSQADTLFVINNGTNALLVYPPVGFKIGTGSTNAGLSVGAGKSCIFMARGDGNYFANLSA